jgi:hypothetical protein
MEAGVAGCLIGAWDEEAAVVREARTWRCDGSC